MYTLRPSDLFLPIKDTRVRWIKALASCLDLVRPPMTGAFFRVRASEYKAEAPCNPRWVKMVDVFNDWDLVQSVTPKHGVTNHTLVYRQYISKPHFF